MREGSLLRNQIFVQEWQMLLKALFKLQAKTKYSNQMISINVFLTIQYEGYQVKDYGYRQSIGATFTMLCHASGLQCE